MEIKQQNNIEKLVGVQRQKQFRVTGKSMHMLFHALINMYSDPIGSIVREITSNALDAHTEREKKKAGDWPLDPMEDIRYLSDNKNVQIEYIESNKILGISQAIIFRDFGVGLSAQRVEDTYTVFGESTKRKSNDEIGGFGLGCKSPFTFTDTFYVTTSFKGQLYYYMLSKTNDGLSMDLMHQEPSNTKNYTEICVPIPDDHKKRQFIDAIEEQLRYIDNIEYININIEHPEILYEDEHVIITDFKSYKQAKVLIGPISYPLDIEHTDLNHIFNYYVSLDQTVIFKFPIGVLELVPSRESIIYSDVTVKALKEKMFEIIEDYKPKLRDLVSTIPDDDIIAKIEYMAAFGESKGIPDNLVIP